MAMPAKYRDALMASCDGNLIVTVDQDPCLLIYPLPEWEILEAKLIKLPTFDERTRPLQRLLVGFATEASFDSQGRILIPTPLRKHASLDKKVALVGQGHRFELWDEQTWEQSCSNWLAQQKEGGALPDALADLAI